MYLKGSANRKPLILNGARQVGKTWLLRLHIKRKPILFAERMTLPNKCLPVTLT